MFLQSQLGSFILTLDAMLTYSLIFFHILGFLFLFLISFEVRFPLKASGGFPNLGQHNPPLFIVVVFLHKQNEKCWSHYPRAQCGIKYYLFIQFVVWTASLLSSQNHL